MSASAPKRTFENGADWGGPAPTQNTRAARNVNYTSLINSPYPSLSYERVVAHAQRFGGHRFGALHDLFQVSPTTMAIRLRQTGLVYR
jgi:hypothetical protein